MANIHDCLGRAIQGGMITQSHGTAAQQEYADLVARFSGMLPLAQAQTEAARVLREARKVKAVARRHQVIAQLQAMVRLQAQIDQAADPAKALKLLLEYDDGARAAGFTGESVRSLQDALVKSAMAGIVDTLREAGRPGLFAFARGKRSRNPALLRDIIDELHGRATGNQSAADLAAAIMKQQERFRQLFNAHGGNIGKLQGYGLPHAHDARAIRKAGFAAWRAAIFDRLDWSRIPDLSTGKPFATAGGKPNRAAADVFLQRIYDSIVTDGWISRDPGLQMGGKALANQRAEHRILHFKDGAAWMDYNAQFGLSDPFAAIVGGLTSMARDVALMRVLGPNPKAGLEFARQVATKRALTQGGAKTINAVARAGEQAKLMLAHLDGTATVPAAGSEAWASFFSGVRGILTGTQLGSAILSSTTDVATISAGARVAGLQPQNIIARATALMASGDARTVAANGGYILDSLSDHSRAGARLGMDTMMPEIADRVSTITMRASGLQIWTDAWRAAIQMEFASELGANAGRAFSALDPRLQDILGQRGITPADWDQLRAPGTIYAPRPGTAFVSPMVWLERTAMPRPEAEGLAMRLQMAIEEQLEIMMPTFNLQARARIIGDAQPGTIRGEAMRTVLQYKSYPISFTISQIQRTRFGRVGSRIGYAAGMVAAVTALGALAIQLKEMAKGRDPRPMTDGKFWFAALAQGGGTGILGDFFFSETSRANGGLAETIAGPAVGLAGDVIGMVAENIGAATQGRDIRMGRDFANFVRFNTPVASSLWYARAAFDRLVADNLQRLLDPDAEQAFREAERRRARDFGNASFWRRGDALPSRGPDLTNMARP